MYICMYTILFKGIYIYTYMCIHIYVCVYICVCVCVCVCVGLPGSLEGKESACNTGDPCLKPGLGRSPG